MQRFCCLAHATNGEAIAKMLQRNKTIQMIYLPGNCIGIPGAKAHLFQVVKRRDCCFAWPRSASRP